jgi:hypothetical protein
MKHKLTFDFVELHMLAVEFTGDIRLPVFGDFAEFISDVDFGHDYASKIGITDILDCPRGLQVAKIKPPAPLAAGLL